MSAVVVGIYSAPASRVPLSSVPEAVLEEGRGLVGDRYHARVGTFSRKLASPDAELTLIEQEEIDRFNRTERTDYAAKSFRRNVVTSGVRLNELVGKTFHIGDTVLHGIRLCEPCAHLATLLAPSVVEDMVGRAGLRARIVTGGTIRTGDPITEPCRSA